MVRASERGQLILIGAISLAFILVTLVVLFNGVLYTETISTSDTSDGASHATVVEYELEGALNDYLERQEPTDIVGLGTDELEERYNKATQNSRSAQVSIGDLEIDPDPDPGEDPVQVSYSYQSGELTMEGTLEIDPDIDLEEVPEL